MNLISDLLKKHGTDIADPNVELSDEIKLLILDMLNPIMKDEEFYDDYMHPTPEDLGDAAIERLLNAVIPRLS